jgi:hypothetical protein
MCDEALAIVMSKSACRCLVRALVLWTIASAVPAHAETERYAVVIGHNQGAADEQLLRYAEDDAQRFSDLISEIGGVRIENQVVLRGKTADPVRRAIIATNERIRTGVQSSPDSVLFIYYSGHGDADALHLGDSRLPLRELESLVRSSPAAVRILIIDSCHSGSLTRVKGGHPGPPLAFAMSSPSAGEGMIVLTASTLTEDSQESDQVDGSFFTHYLISGLRGAADDNGDHIITVAEAFAYTREQTILASSRTLVGTQHPTFHYDLRGRADLALADVSDTEQRGQLALPPGATWLVMRAGPARTVVGEISADARRRTLTLRPGAYAVRGRARDALLEGTVTVSAGRATEIDVDQLDRTMYARLVRKGKGKLLASVSGPFVGYSAQTDALDRQVVTFHGLVLGWTWVRSSFTLSARGTATRTHSERLDTLDLRIARAWELGGFSTDLGFAIGGGRGRRTSFDPKQSHMGC